ncbi:MAG: hypothetical protein PHC88_08540 [Terrimicrobiaceae bacterium]|nr:hypothetical protein [Terrimicrobiaceae bacterium]
MKLPADAIIARRKLTHYLLVPLAQGDKSRFLAKAGYDLNQADQLLEDLRGQVLPGDAEELHRTEYGQYHQIRSLLTGPNGRTLRIRTIWMTEHLSQRTKFVTLIPEKTLPE